MSNTFLTVGCGRSLRNILTFCLSSAAGPSFSVNEILCLDLAAVRLEIDGPSLFAPGVC